MDQRRNPPSIYHSYYNVCFLSTRCRRRPRGLLTVWPRLVDAARDRQGELRPAEADAYGRRFVLDFEIGTAAGSATIRSAWIVLAGEDVLRFVTCYVL